MRLNAARPAGSDENYTLVENITKQLFTTKLSLKSYGRRGKLLNRQNSLNWESRWFTPWWQVTVHTILPQARYNTSAFRQAYYTRNFPRFVHAIHARNQDRWPMTHDPFTTHTWTNPRRFFPPGHYRPNNFSKLIISGLGESGTTFIS